jgi:hypothetical protein
MVMYRPGEGFGRVLDRLAGTWQVSRHEAAKQLAILAAFGFSAEERVPVAALAASVGGTQDFLQAAQQLKVAVDTANRTRQELGHEPLNETTRAALIQHTLTRLIEGKETPRPVEDSSTEPRVETSSFERRRRTIRVGPDAPKTKIGGAEQKPT